ncbi:MAG: PAS domain S-box protein, partial [bacterium]
MGYKKDELIGKNFLKLNLLSPGQIPKAVENLAKNALGRPTGPDEFILNRKDGSKVSLEISTFPVKIEDKRVVIGIARDITERKKTEAEFERQQKFIQLVADTATNLIFVKDKDGRFLFANNAMGKAFGTTPEALINKHNAEIHDHPEEVKKYLEDDAEVLRTMRPVEIEETQTLKDGKVLHFQTVKTPLVVDNRTVHILGVSTDITRLKRAEQALREERYRAVVDQSADCIFLADVETGQIVEANTAFQRLLGYSQEEAQKLTFHDFVAHPHEDINERMQRARKQGRLFLGERLYRRKDQTLISVEVNASVVSYSGRKVFCVVSRDMTERKQAEKEIARLKELYSHILDSLPFQIGLFDLDGRFLYVNAAAIKDTDMREWIIGKTHIDYCRKRKISEEIGRRRFEAIQKCIQLREIVSYEEKFPSRHKMGYRDFIRHFSPVINAAGEVIQVIGYSVEITEQKHSEAAQKKLEAQMQHAQKLES